MVVEATRPQNSLSEAGNRQKSHKTDIHLHAHLSRVFELSSTSLVYTDLYRHLAWLYRPPENHLPRQIKQVEGKFNVEIVSQQLCAGVISIGFCAHTVEFAKSIDNIITVYILAALY